MDFLTLYILIKITLSIKKILLIYQLTLFFKKKKSKFKIICLNIYLFFNFFFDFQ